jgi:hypothetical protein
MGNLRHADVEIRPHRRSIAESPNGNGRSNGKPK